MSVFVGGIEFRVCQCDCGVVYALASGFIQARREDHKTFYCPNGCNRWYPGKTDKEKRIDSLTAEVNRLESSLNCKRSTVKRLEYEKRHWKGEVTKLKKKDKK